MRAALCKSLEKGQKMIIEDIEKPQVAPGEVLVRVEAAALNFFDNLITRGKYQYKPDLPFSPCAEIAGIIEELGEGVTGFDICQRVIAYMGWGGARQYVSVRAELLTDLPDQVSFEVGCGIPVTYGTGYYGLKDRGHLQPGETLAVLGAAGGAGLAAVELGKQMGARVIAVASTEDKLAVCREHGADEVINYQTADLKQALKEVTGGRGVDVVYDCVGGAHSEAALRAMAWEGRLLIIGFAGGEIPKLPANLMLLKGCDVVGVFWGSMLERTPELQAANSNQILDWCATGAMVPHIHGTYPLDQIGAAMEVLAKREAKGKVVILPQV